MKNVMKIFLCLAFLGLACISKAGDLQLTPDGYLGHPAFEFGLNGQNQSETFTDNYSYTNYSNLATLKGNANYSFNNVFLNVYYPVSDDLTLIAGGSILVNYSATSSFSETANTFNGTENETGANLYPSSYNWFVSCRVYTK